MIEGYSGIGERMSCERGFREESVPVNSQRMEQHSHSWLARYGKGSRKKPDTSSVRGEERRDEENELEKPEGAASGELHRDGVMSGPSKSVKLSSIGPRPTFMTT